MARKPVKGHTQVSVLGASIPIAMGYIPLGAVFGFLFVQAGGPAWLAVTSSVLIFAGAAQFMMVPMLAAGLPISAIVLATLILNLRHIFYGLSLLQNMPASWWQRCYSIFALTDETYSVLTAMEPARRTRLMALVSLLNHSWWVLGTILGVVLGAQVQIGFQGLDFVLAALFAVLAVEQWRQKRDFVPIWTAIAAYLLAVLVLPAQALFVAIALSLLAAALRPGKAQQSINSTRAHHE